MRKIDLRTAAIRLAYQKPELRPYLLPLLTSRVARSSFLPSQLGIYEDRIEKLLVFYPTWVRDLLKGVEKDPNLRRLHLELREATQGLVMSIPAVMEMIQRDANKRLLQEYPKVTLVLNQAGQAASALEEAVQGLLELPTPQRIQNVRRFLIKYVTILRPLAVALKTNPLKLAGGKQAGDVLDFAERKLLLQRQRGIAPEPDMGEVSDYPRMQAILRRLQVGDKVEITYRDLQRGGEVKTVRTVSHSWGDLKEKYPQLYKEPKVLLDPKVQGKHKSGMISDYGGGDIYWQPTMLGKLSPVIALKRLG